jgi:hypothetical protein
VRNQGLELNGLRPNPRTEPKEGTERIRCPALTKAASLCGTRSIWVWRYDNNYAVVVLLYGRELAYSAQRNQSRLSDRADAWMVWLGENYLESFS